MARKFVAIFLILSIGVETAFSYPMRSDVWSERRQSKPNGVSKGIVYHVLDIHGNIEAQTNIARTLSHLIGEHQIDAVMLEGAFGPMEIAPLQKFSDRAAVKRVSDYLLRQHSISGAANALVNTDQAIFGFGIDDFEHYKSNVNAYLESARVTPKMRAWRAAAETALDAKKSRTLNHRLARFDRMVENYRDGKIPLTTYINELSGSSEIEAFKQAAQLENTLSFAEVEKQRTRLRAIAGRAINLNRDYPALAGYLRYRSLAQSIDVQRLFDDIAQAERRIYSKLIKTPEERALINESRVNYLRGRLIDFALTKKEWDEYVSLSHSSRFDPSTDFAPFENFYREAEIRDLKMAENLLRVTASGGHKNFALVTGGFHAKGIDRRLVAAGFTVQQIVPKITRIDGENGSTYLSVFSQEKTPLENLFEGQKLFLSPNVFSSAAAESLKLGILLDIEAQDPAHDLPQADEQEILNSLGSRSTLSQSAKDVAPGVAQLQVDEKGTKINLQLSETNDRVASLQEHYESSPSQLYDSPKAEKRFTPDDEFLTSLRLGFWGMHENPNVWRRVGVLFLWAAILAPPFLYFLIPNNRLTYSLFAATYLSNIIAIVLAQFVRPGKYGLPQLPSWGKVLLAPTYILNVFSHGTWNSVVPVLGDGELTLSNRSDENNRFPVVNARLEIRKKYDELWNLSDDALVVKTAGSPDLQKRAWKRTEFNGKIKEELSEDEFAVLESVLHKILSDFEEHKEYPKYQRFLEADEEHLIFKAIISKNLGENRRDFLINMVLIMNMGLIRGGISAKASRWNDEDIQDAYQVACFKIVHDAIPHFDLSKNYRFSTYAKEWFKPAINEIERHQRNVRIPYWLLDFRRAIMKAGKEFQQQFGRWPSKEEIAYAINEERLKLIFKDTVFSEETLKRLAISGKYHDLQLNNLSKKIKARLLERIVSADDVANASISRRELSIAEAPNNDRNDSPVPSQIASLPASYSHTATVEEIEIWNTINRHINSLDPRERETVADRFALNGNGELLLKEIAEKHKITPERVRQMESEALQKIRVKLNTNGIASKSHHIDVSQIKMETPAAGTKLTKQTLLQYLLFVGKKGIPKRSLYDGEKEISARLFVTREFEQIHRGKILFERASSEVGWPVLIAGDVFDAEQEGRTLSNSEIEGRFGLIHIPDVSIPLRYPERYFRTGSIDVSLTTVVSQNGDIKATYFGHLPNLKVAKGDKIYFGEALEFKGAGSPVVFSGIRRLNKKGLETLEQVWELIIEHIKSQPWHRRRRAKCIERLNDFYKFVSDFFADPQTDQCAMDPSGNNQMQLWIVRFGGKFYVDTEIMPPWLKKLKDKGAAGIFLNLPYQSLPYAYSGEIGINNRESVEHGLLVQKRFLANDGKPATLSVSKTPLDHIGRTMEYRIRLTPPVRLEHLDHTQPSVPPAIKNPSKLFLTIGQQMRAAFRAKLSLTDNKVWKDVLADGSFTDFGEWGINFADKIASTASIFAKGLLRLCVNVERNEALKWFDQLIIGMFGSTRPGLLEEIARMLNRIEFRNEFMRREIKDAIMNAPAGIFRSNTPLESRVLHSQLNAKDKHLILKETIDRLGNRLGELLTSEEAPTSMGLSQLTGHALENGTTSTTPRVEKPAVHRNGIDKQFHGAKAAQQAA